LIPDLEKFIYDTLQAQTALTAIVGTRITNIYGSRATLTFPYVVYQITEDQEQDTFRGDGMTCTMEFHIFDVAEGNTNANARAIIDQIRGNAATQSNKVPTYGLHRLIPGTMPSNWQVSQIMRTGGSTAHERDILHYIETYRCTGSIGT
jgi:hypothetical protein